MVRRLPRPTREQFDQVYDAYEDLSSNDPLRSFINKFSPVPLVEAPEGLTPIGDNGLYATPDEPADPFDCDRFPSSPYCGENPFSLTPVSLEPSIVIDSCNIGIQFDGTFGFIKVPPVAIVYRRKECRNKPLEQEQPEGEIEDKFYQPLTYQDIGCAEGIAGLYSTSSIYFRERLRDGNTFPAFKTSIYIERKVSITSFVYPYIPPSPFNVGDRLLLLIGFKSTGRQIDNQDIPGLTQFTDVDYGQPPSTVSLNLGNNEGVNIWEIVSLPFSNDPNRTRGVKNVTREFIEGGIIGGRVEGGIGNTFDDIHPRANETQLLDFPGYAQYTSPGIYITPNLVIGEGNIKNAYNYEREYKDDFIYLYRKARFQPVAACDIPRFPPPPPIPKPQCCMSCCPSRNNDDTLLRLLIKKVDKLSKIVGVDEYPASLPASLISKDEGFLGNLIPNFNTEIPNLTRLISWYVERFDEIMGQWEIPIEVKDADPTKPGDQPVGFKLPNMAEAIAEMFGLMLQTSINSETLLNMNTRALLEGGQIKQQGFKTYMMAQAIADHLGFQYQETKHEIPMLFKIGEGELDKLLQESTLEVTALEHTDTSDLKTTLNDLLQAAAIIRAVHFRQFDPKQDVKQQFKNLINNLVASGDKVNNQQTDSAGKDDFDRFVEDVETGFTQYPGASDPLHPYGRDYSERPKIKEISIDTSDSNS